MAATGDELLSLIYSSRATQPFTDDDLNALHEQSRVNNQGTQLTGLLLYRPGRFVQALEGPEEALRDRMSIIEEDCRHSGVRLLLEEHIERRRFPHWAMEYRPLTAAMTDSIPGYTTVFDALDREDARPAQLQGALAALMGWYQARAAQAW